MNRIYFPVNVEFCLWGWAFLDFYMEHSAILILHAAGCRRGTIEKRKRTLAWKQPQRRLLQSSLHIQSAIQTMPMMILTQFPYSFLTCWSKQLLAHANESSEMNHHRIELAQHPIFTQIQYFSRGGAVSSHIQLPDTKCNWEMYMHTLDVGHSPVSSIYQNHMPIRLKCRG